MAKISQNNKRGFVNTDGEIIIPCNWNDAGEFSEGLCPVYDADGKMGFIDRTGKLVLPCKWDNHTLYKSEFIGGYARVNKDDLWGVIDKRGELVVDCQWDEIFIDPVGVIQVKKNDKWALIRMDGTAATKLEWKYVNDFCQGLSACSGEDGVYVYLDENLNEAFRLDSAFGAYSFEEAGLACVWLRENRKRGVINMQGELVVPAVWDELNILSPEGFIRVWRDEKCGLLDREGRTVLEPEWDKIDLYAQENMIVASRDAQREGRLFDLDGNILLTFEYGSSR